MYSLKVNGAGDRDSITVAGYDGDVCGAGIVLVIHGGTIVAGVIAGAGVVDLLTDEGAVFRFRCIGYKLGKLVTKLLMEKCDKKLITILKLLRKMFARM